MLFEFVCGVQQLLDSMGHKIGRVDTTIDSTVENTAIGASQGVKAAVAVYRLTQTPALVAMAAVAGVVGAYWGAQQDNDNRRVRQHEREE